MADMMQFDLVSPERRLASFEAREVQIPGADGDLTAMSGHAPLITTLRPGVLKAAGADGAKEFAVLGGFAEITAEGTTVLAEEAMPTDEVTSEFLSARISAATEMQSKAEGEAADVAGKLAADLRDLGSALGVSV